MYVVKIMAQCGVASIARVAEASFRGVSVRLYSRSMGSMSTAALTAGVTLRVRNRRTSGAEMSSPKGAFTTMW